MKNFLESSIENKKILISCGSGGVGKTTLSASLACYAAEKGKKTIVLTIDPAQRLAQALGFEKFSNKIQKIELKKGELYAAMLDTKQVFNELIQTCSPSATITKQILSNPIYQHVSDGLTGIHEYMACAKLYEFYSKNEYDLIILDTPPMKKAFEFLEAPERISAFFDTNIFHWFLKPYFRAGQMGLKFMFKGSSLALKVIEHFSGLEVLRSLHDFFLNFEGMYDAFTERATSIYKTLRSPNTGFLLITTPQPHRYLEAATFYKILKQKKMPFEGFIFNQVFPQWITSKVSIPHFIAEHNLTLFKDERASEVLGKMLDYIADLDKLAYKEKIAVKLLNEELGMTTTPILVPKLTAEVDDIEGLFKLHQYLFKQ